MTRALASASVLLACLLLLPASAFSQSAITGVVRDTSGAVQPGVTIEASSDVLIERVRSVTSDVFNVNNSGAIVSYVNTNALSAGYLAPNSILQGRMYGVGVTTRW